ncbi:MAG: PQQ-binding-like beta-propeller repeat protein [Planctomycetaceae bacterium]|nr:PQQ-binding-like beta-propeller repeat protein [Planctomycetaceae bacterium]
MLMRTFLVVCCLSSLFLVDSASAQLGNTGTKSALPTKKLLSRYALERGWWSHAVIDQRGDEVKYMTIDDALVFVQSKQGNITALDIQTGKQVWYYKYGRFNEYSSKIVADKDSVYFISGVHLIALDRFTGNEKWMLRLPGAITSEILIDDTQIYFGDITGMFYAIDLERTNEFAKRGELPRSSFDTVNWRYRSADAVKFSPVRVEEEVIFVSEDGTMYGLARSDKKQFMHFEGDSPVVAPLSTKGQNLFLSVADPSFRLDKRIFCLNERTGQTIWQRVLTQPVLQRMIVIKDNLFVVPARQGLMMLDTESGQKFWQNREAVRFIALTNSFVIAEDDLDYILILDRNNGKTLGRLPLRSFPIRYQNEYTDRIYLASKDGFIVSLNEEGSDFPTFFRNLEEQPIEPEMAVPGQSEQEEGGSRLEPEMQEEKTDDAGDSDLLSPDKPVPPEKPPADKDDNDGGFFNLFNR